jgi:hypothetical protein
MPCFHEAIRRRNGFVDTGLIREDDIGFLVGGQSARRQFGTGPWVAGQFRQLRCLTVRHDTVEAGMTGRLYGEMRALLDDEEYENFVAAVSRLAGRPQRIG